MTTRKTGARPSTASHPWAAHVPTAEGPIIGPADHVTPALSSTVAPTPDTPASARAPTTVGEPRVAYEAGNDADDEPVEQDWDAVQCVDTLQKSGITPEQALAIAGQMNQSRKSLLAKIARLDKRVIRIESRTEHMATQKDIADLHKAMNRQTLTMVGMMIAMLSVLVALNIFGY